MHPLVPPCHPHAEQRVVTARNGFLRLVGLRWATGPPRPVAYSVRFCAAWCGIGYRDARIAIAELQATGVIQRAGSVGRRITLYLPGRGVR